MIKAFPPLNGPDAVAVDDPRFDEVYLSDYCCASNAIYVGFAWSLQEEAYRHILMCAAKHKVGFFDVSADHFGAVWLPTGDGYEVAHGGSPGNQASVKEISAWFKLQPR